MADTTETSERPAVSLSKNHSRLRDTDKRKVLDLVEARGFACRACASRHPTIGDALEMGSIWPDEKLGTYMIALTCQNCNAPSGVRLHEAEFLPAAEEFPPTAE